MPSTPMMVASTPGFLEPLKSSAWSSAQVATPLRYMPSHVEAVGELLVHHRSLGEGEVLHVARQPDQHGLAGLGVDAGHRHGVRAQAPAARAGVAAHQQHVVAPLVGVDRRAVAEHRDHEVALHADDVGAEEQGAGDGEAEEAVDADDGEAVLALQGQRLAEAPGVDEEVRPADGERHQAEAQHRSSRRCWSRPEGDAVPDVRHHDGEQADDHQGQPGPQRDPADPAVPETSCADPGGRGS